MTRGARRRCAMNRSARTMETGVPYRSRQEKKERIRYRYTRERMSCWQAASEATVRQQHRFPRLRVLSCSPRVHVYAHAFCTDDVIEIWLAFSSGQQDERKGRGRGRRGAGASEENHH
ncbi:hypothetical protein KQX54_010766 [Cotesia glomerata]|uniref:Uncharacterized protein n=1 Tax=Cotesia glomerata TaxID=32391 RepID=A0AAV7J4D1_COTGL|nr:hypothetical protein KQX54_010766 [Cotesia glomerata]